MVEEIEIGKEWYVIHTYAGYETKLGNAYYFNGYGRLHLPCNRA